MRVPLALALVVIPALGCQLLLGIEHREASQDPEAGLDASAEKEASVPEDGALDATTTFDGDTGSPSNDPFAPRAGDVVVLDPSSILLTGTRTFEAWQDRVSPRKAIPARTTVPGIVKLGDASCVAFSGGDYLRVEDDGALDPGGRDFSLIAVVRPSIAGTGQSTFGSVAVARAEPLGPVASPPNWRYSYRGIALMTEHAEPIAGPSKRFSARLEYVHQPTTITEIFEPLRLASDYEKLTVAAVQQKGTKLYLHVGDKTYETSATAAQPAQAPLLVGKVDEDDDLVATTFRGLVCGVVYHVGEESTADVTARIRAIRLVFPP